jgi:16S rRNA (cytosine967-C5)-methyltransferase
MVTRYLAVTALSRIFKRQERPKDTLEDLGPDLDERERGFLMELVYGVLRRRDYLDRLLKDFLRKPSGLPDLTVNNLRVALYQLRFMRVPEWAAVDEAVSVEKRHRGGKAPLVNAVLRSYLRAGPAEPELPGDPVSRISVLTSHPEWLVRRWAARMGVEEAERLALKNNENPPLTLRIDIGRDEALRVLEAAGIDALPTPYAPSGVVVGQGETSALDGRGDARRQRVTPFNIPLPPSSYVVQDEAAQLVAWLLDPGPGERVLDACAAPGGKATHIARMMGDEGEVIAVDADSGRAGRIGENSRRLGLHIVRVVAGDIRRLEPGGAFDRVLVDAPCSSLGVVRRNPDVKYRHAESDLARLGRLQLEILTAAAGYMKQGGVLVYSVCSTEPEEGEDVVRFFLQSNPDFSIIKGHYDFLDDFAYNDDYGNTFYRTWPHRAGPRACGGYGMDGFFAARLKKGL